MMRYSAFKNVATSTWVVLDRETGLPVVRDGEALQYGTKREATEVARDMNVFPKSPRTIHLNDEQMGVVFDALRNWDNMLGGRFPVVEPWDWPSSHSPNEKSYRKALSQCLSLVKEPE